MSPNRPERDEHPIEMISAYMDGRLEAVERARVHDHLGHCTPCQWILADFRALAAAARREAVPTVPSHLLEKIGRQLDAASAVRAIPARSRFLPRARLPLATAAAVLVMATLWVVWRGRIPGERLAESRWSGAPPASAPATDQPQAPQPEAAAPPRPETASPTQSKPGAAPPVKQAAPSEAGSVKGGLLDSFAPSPPPPPPPAALQAPSIKKDEAGQAGAVADREKSKELLNSMLAGRSLAAAPPQSAAPPPAEKLERDDSEARGMPLGAVEGGAVAQAQAGGPPTAGTAKPAATSRMTLVLVLPEARVSVLPSLGIVLIAGDYACALPAGGQEEARGLAELRTFASGQRRAARTGLAEDRPAGFTSAEGNESQDLVVPAPPAAGPLSPEAAAEAHRRLWILLRESLLARAEAQCGPVPEALQPAN